MKMINYGFTIRTPPIFFYSCIISWHALFSHDISTRLFRRCFVVVNRDGFSANPSPVYNMPSSLFTPLCCPRRRVLAVVYSFIRWSIVNSYRKVNSTVMNGLRENRYSCKRTSRSIIRSCFFQYGRFQFTSTWTGLSSIQSDTLKL